jgi:2'-5' RNA ligase
MQTSSFSSQGILPFNGLGRETLAEYFFLIPPDETLAEEVKSLKRNFSRRFGFLDPVYAVPHITLFKFLMAENNESFLFDLTKTSVSRHAGQELKVRDFILLGNNICLSLQNQEALLRMQKELRTLLLRNKRIHPDGRSFPFSPNSTNLHITVARAIPEGILEDAWADYRERNFSYTLGVDKVILLKRTLQAKHWSVLKEFPLGKNILAERNLVSLSLA